MNIYQKSERGAVVISLTYDKIVGAGSWIRDGKERS